MEVRFEVWAVDHKEELRARVRVDVPSLWWGQCAA